MIKQPITMYSEELIAAILRLAVALEDHQTNVGDQPAEGPIHGINAPEAEHPITLEEIRAVLVAKSKLGGQEQVKALIMKYGAVKLTEVNPLDYTDLLKEAERLYVVSAGEPSVSI